MPNRIEIATNWIMLEEGWEYKPYYCSQNFPSIGWGFRIGNKGEPLPDITMSHIEGDKKLAKLISACDVELATTPQTAKAYAACNDVRKAMMISMLYQLGLSKLLGFKHTLKAIENQEWALAGDMMMDSLAARQTPDRWQRQAKVMRTGELK